MSKIPSKVKVFVWLVAHKKANTNDMLQLKRPFKALDLTSAFCIRGEMIDHLLFFFFYIAQWLWGYGTIYSDMQDGVGSTLEYMWHDYHLI